jgi:hypothetical protein
MARRALGSRVSGPLAVASLAGRTERSEAAIQQLEAGMDPAMEDRVTSCPSRTTALRESLAGLRRGRRSDQPPITGPGK